MIYIIYMQNIVDISTLNKELTKRLLLTEAT